MKKYITLVLIIASLMFAGCSNSQTVAKNISVNGQQISGLTNEEAIKKVSDIAKSQQKEIEIILKHEDNEFVIKGEEFNGNFETFSKSVLSEAKPNFFESMNIFDNTDKNIQIKNADLLFGLDEKIDEIACLIDCEPSGGEVVLKSDNNFIVSDTNDGCFVNKELLKQQINSNLLTQNKIELQIPTIIKTNQVTKEYIESNLKKRSEFSTDYSASAEARKYNVKLSLSAFNGMKIEPGQEVSFNDVVSTKINDNDFKTAKIILNGEFVDGKGGGMCQASTTLYNALLLADLQILEVHSHSLPITYVPLGFDAMVNQGSSDLRFVNNLQAPIYLKTWGDDDRAYVEIWGQPFEEGNSIRTRSDFIGTIPHPGDKIIPDSEGKYSNIITFKGEYHRAKMPQVGYECKSFIEYLQDGEVVDEKQIRHEYYQSQHGVIYEGVEDVIDGISLPENSVKFIPPQK